jgi:hypothetical protein
MLGSAVMHRSAPERSTAARLEAAGDDRAPSRHTAVPGRNVKRQGVVAVVVSIAVAVAALSYVAAPGGGAPLVDRVKIGAYLHLAGRPYRDPVAPADLAFMEERIGRLDIVHSFFDWGRSFRDAVTSNLDGRDLMLSIQPVGNLVRQIKDGAQDAYIDGFAGSARDYHRPVYLRFGHEMNGEWMSYSAGSAGGPKAADFRGAWQRLVDRFRARRGQCEIRLVAERVRLTGPTWQSPGGLLARHGVRRHRRVRRLQLDKRRTAPR